MEADKGDRLVVHGRVVGEPDRVVEVIEVLGPPHSPPFRVRDERGHELIIVPGPDSQVEHAADR